MSIGTAGLTFFSTLTLLADIILAYLLLTLLYGYLKKEDYLDNIFRKKAVLFSFIVALTATLGSLFFSEIAGFEPCTLCWFQRIFMYPLSIILLTAIVRKHKRINEIVIPLAIIGWIFSAYQYVLQVLASASPFCSTDSVSCTTNFTFHFGYITIPFMALTAFSLIIIFSIIKKN